MVLAVHAMVFSFANAKSLSLRSMQQQPPLDSCAKPHAEIGLDHWAWRGARMWWNDAMQ
jgi:hypothetical protein